MLHEFGAALDIVEPGCVASRHHFETGAADLLHTRNRALPFVVLAGVCGLTVLVLLAAARPMVARAIAALGVGAVIWGWGVAQYPMLLPRTNVTLSNAGAPHATLVAIIVLAVVAALLVGPSFALLFTLQGRGLLQAGEVPRHESPADDETATAEPGAAPARTSGRRWRRR